MRGRTVATYLGVLALLFGGAFALGSVFGGDGEQEHGGTAAAEHATTATTGQGEEIGGSHGEAARGPGATDRHVLELQLEPSSLRAGEAGEITFRIRDAGGDPVTEFEVEHTKRLHLIVVRKDLSEFAHVHPEAGGRGTWRVPLQLGQPGEYRVIADVRYEGRRIALAGDLEVGGEPRAVGQPVQEATFEEQQLTAGQPVTLEFTAPGRTEPYLGAAGHLVILREGDLEYLHVHPRQDRLAFEATFPEPGRYVMFLEYERTGEVRLARFPVTVS